MRIVKHSFFLCLFLSLTCTHLPAQTNRDTSQWEREIQAFEASDRTNPPPQNAILFVGSSSIRKWTNLAHDFPDKRVINRGFGGSQIADSTALAERIIFPYHPRLIVFYAGDNDLAAGRSVEQVVADYRAFVEKIQAHLPNTPIAYISIKPSPSRWQLREKMVTANAQIKAMSNDILKFIDVYSPMLGADGKPRPELFLADNLHPSAKCYQLWTELIDPYLK
jgi:lysophospholipase L1-like esterase